VRQYGGGLIDDLARHRIAYVPFFPLGGFTPLQSSTLSEVARRLGATPMQIALAWLLRRAPNVLLIPGTSSITHLRENLAVGDLGLPADAVMPLDGIGAPALTLCEANCPTKGRWKLSDVNGGQGRNRTTDPRIFRPFPAVLGA
jgi:diketogulonate reductase-like aldo/keto reductase